jgi:hypothetical protein
MGGATRAIPTVADMGKPHRIPTVPLIPMAPRPALRMADRAGLMIPIGLIPTAIHPMVIGQPLAQLEAMAQLSPPAMAPPPTAASPPTPMDQQPLPPAMGMTPTVRPPRPQAAPLHRPGRHGGRTATGSPRLQMRNGGGPGGQWRMTRGPVAMRTEPRTELQVAAGSLSVLAVIARRLGSVPLTPLATCVWLPKGDALLPPLTTVMKMNGAMRMNGFRTACDE